MQSRLVSRQQFTRSRRVAVPRAQVRFTIKKKVSWGDRLCIVGDHEKLGKWRTDEAAQLKWSDGHVWTADMEMPENSKLEYKVVNVKGQGDPRWEKGDNRKLKVGSDDMTVDMAWDRTNNGAVHPGNGSHHEPSMQVGELQVGAPADTLAPNVWQGKQIEFMQENRHSRDRSGVWNTDGLEGPVLALVAGDQKSGSWLQKLEQVKEVLVESAEDMRPSMDILAPTYVYMQWITTGSIPCVESGGHHRPNKHAELSKLMFRSLEWVAGDSNKTDIERWIARRMSAKLPSFSESFTASVPLTRIRDIAHRNDIPSDLKREIKHTLQNKLHRNAGPEDLVATEAMLQRVTAPGTDYSGAFVHEFRVFTEELRDFFNASGLVTVLQRLQPSMQESAVTDIQRFMETKNDLDSGNSGRVVDCMHQLTTVRSQLVSGLATGLRNDAPDTAMVMRQRWRLAELRCEDYAFILLSRYLNDMDSSNMSAQLTQGRNDVWANPLGMLVLSVRHLGLSGWKPAECFALDNDISTWQKLGVAGSQDDTMRLMSSLSRTQRLTTSFVDGQLHAFSGHAKQMGAALGLSDHLQTVFSESEIRASVAFQVSKLNTVLLQACREILGMGSYDGLVLGTGTGELVKVDRIEPGMNVAEGRSCVLLLNSASGDEEITTAGPNIKGVLLCQELPHLSHLGVRARQEMVPFATCTQLQVVEEQLLPLVGSQIILDVTADAVTVEKADSSAAAALPAGISVPDSVPEPVAAPTFTKVDVAMVKVPTVLPVTEATQENSGAKAHVCGQLGRLVKDYKTPRGAVLPFGNMEVVVQESGAQAEFNSCLEVVQRAPVGSELDDACLSMQKLLSGCMPAEVVLQQLQTQLDGASIVIARSSANVEDLAGLSGAGLYESIPNLSLADQASLGPGIAQVWSSLFSRRAVLSRRAAGVQQSDACMAVLVQEMLVPDYSFVLHTRNPLAKAGAGNEGDLYAEIAPGMGETLASGAEGAAWRMNVSESSQAVTMRAFANFSEAYLPVSGAQAVPLVNSIYDTPTTVMDKGTVTQKVVSYGSYSLSTDQDARDRVGGALFNVGKHLETELGGPQDIEGALVGESLYIVQSRPQP